MFNIRFIRVQELSGSGILVTGDGVNATIGILPTNLSTANVDKKVILFLNVNILPTLLKRQWQDTLRI
jgi:hypothetical protein